MVAGLYLSYNFFLFSSHTKISIYFLNKFISFTIIFLACIEEVLPLPRGSCVFCWLTLNNRVGSKCYWVVHTHWILLSFITFADVTGKISELSKSYHVYNLNVITSIILSDSFLFLFLYLSMLFLFVGKDTFICIFIHTSDNKAVLELSPPIINLSVAENVAILFCSWLKISFLLFAV